MLPFHKLIDGLMGLVLLGGWCAELAVSCIIVEFKIVVIDSGRFFKQPILGTFASNKIVCVAICIFPQREQILFSNKNLIREKIIYYFKNTDL